MQPLVRPLFIGLLTPAVAGNIIWTLCGVFIAPQNLALAFAPTLVTLGILAYYLLYDFLLILTDDAEDLNIRVAVFEGAHLVVMALVAWSSIADELTLQKSLTLYLAIILTGNLWGVWKLSTPRAKWGLVVADVIGIIILWQGPVFGIVGGWNIPACLFVSLAVWLAWARPRSFTEMAEVIKATA